ncbi:MAG: hypothetical protein AB8G96_11315 [Phycisphaerales bacterium]
MFRRLQQSSNFLCTLAGVVVLAGPASLAMQTAQAQAIPLPPAGGAIPVPATRSVADVVDDRETAWNTIFSTAHNADEWTYLLDRPVDDTGIYVGANSHGEAFELDARMVTEVDVTDPALGISGQDQAWLLANDYRFTTTIGLLGSTQGSIPVIGMTVWSPNAQGVHESRFFINGLEDPSSGLFDPETEAASSYTIDFSSFGVPILVPTPIFCPDPACVDACNDEYDDAVKDAEEAYQEARDAAGRAARDRDAANEARRDQSKTDADNAMNDARDAADVELRADLENCTGLSVGGVVVGIIATAGSWFTAGASSATFALGCLALDIACANAATDSHSEAVADAKATQSAAHAAADAQYEADQLDSFGQLLDDLDDAMWAQSNAIQDAEAALLECLDGCPMVVCGWVFHIEWILFF